MRFWIRLIAALLGVALLVWLAWSMVGGIVHLLSGADSGDAEPDPMFAQEAEIPTRPPELDAEVSAPDHLTLDDYALPEGAPVDKTADELIREAQQKNS